MLTHLCPTTPIPRGHPASEPADVAPHSRPRGQLPTGASQLPGPSVAERTGGNGTYAARGLCLLGLVESTRPLRRKKMSHKCGLTRRIPVCAEHCCGMPGSPWASSVSPLCGQDVSVALWQDDKECQPPAPAPRDSRGPGFPRGTGGGAGLRDLSAEAERWGYQARPPETT